MKFETKNKPELYCYNGTEYYSDGGASFEWLIDKLRDGGAFHLKKNETIHIEEYTFTCINHEKKKEGTDIVASVIIKCESYNFYIKCIDTYNSSDISDIYDTKLYWFDDKENNLPHENPQWNEIKLELKVEDN